MLRGAKRRGNPFPARHRRADGTSGTPSPTEQFDALRAGRGSEFHPARGISKRKTTQRPPDTRKHTVLPVSIRLKSTEKTPACVSMRAFLQPISARIYFGKTASHRKRARFVQSRGASPQAYWMSVKAAQRRGCAKRAFCGVCFLMSGGLKGGFSLFFALCAAK